MLTAADRDYYRQRSEVERQRAITCFDPRVVACHLELAQRYGLLVSAEAAENPALPLLAA